MFEHSELNAFEGDYAGLVSECEAQYERRLDEVAREIHLRREVKLVAVAGPSSAGKTTSTEKLAKKLRALGVKSKVLSIDNFFIDPDIKELQMDGNTDFESLGCVDLALLHECIHALANGMTATIPKFDFTLRKRSMSTEKTALDSGEIILLEGLHALNPQVYGNAISCDATYKIYLNTFRPDGSISERARLIRRIVRDYNFRATDAEFTLYLWDSIVRGERENITPFVDFSDAQVNTYFAYEPCVLKPFAQKVLREVKESSKYYSFANQLLCGLEPILEIDSKYVPEGSLMREFIG